MNTGEWDLKRLSDDELLKSLQLIVGSERLAVARVVAHLAEVEERRLHLKVGCSSLFDYCLRRLALSEGEAFRRMTAARLVRRFPMILGLIAEGDIHLSALCELRDFLTKDNHRELLEEASRKTKKQVQELVARRFPRPDVSSTIRRLPAPASVQTERLLLPPAEATAKGSSDGAGNTITATPSSPPPLPAPRPTPPTIVEPLQEDRYRLQLSASSDLKRKLDHARDLLSHGNRTGDLAVVVERALDVLIDKLERERFGQAKRPRSGSAPQPDRRRIPNAVRREVIARDGWQCSYVSPDGQRCPCTQFLQFHHEHAWALGGTSEAANIRILCAAHNQLLAENDFGRQVIGAAVAASRARMLVAALGRQRQDG